VPECARAGGRGGGVRGAWRSAREPVAWLSSAHPGLSHCLPAFPWSLPDGDWALSARRISLPRWPRYPERLPREGFCVASAMHSAASCPADVLQCARRSAKCRLHGSATQMTPSSPGSLTQLLTRKSSRSSSCGCTVCLGKRLHGSRPDGDCSRAGNDGARDCLESSRQSLAHRGPGIHPARDLGRRIEALRLQLPRGEVAQAWSPRGSYSV
jgi:hypothetical protein